MRLEPVNLDEGSWYYENKGSIDVIVEHGPVGSPRSNQGILANSAETSQLRIPARKLAETLRRQGYKVSR